MDAIFLRQTAWAFGLLALVGAAAPLRPGAVGQSDARVVYVSARGATGGSVADLTPDDFTVKDGGKTCAVTGAAVATAPMQIALLVDDNGTGIFRSALAHFVERLDGRAAFSLSAVEGQTMRLVDFTTNVREIGVALARLNARPGTPDGGQLLEGIFEATKELRRREAERPIIVAVTVGGEEHSTVSAHQVLEELQRSGASLHVFAVVGGALRSTAAVTRPSALLEENLNLSEVLGDGPRQSGGRHDEIVASAGAVNGLQQLAAELKDQYAVRYVLPDGTRSSGKISVSVRRRGVTLRAPSRVPPQ
jgi:VWFA-related protein